MVWEELPFCKQMPPHHCLLLRLTLRPPPPPHTTPYTPSPAAVPEIFASLGSGRSAALENTVIIGAVNVVATFVSIFTVDKFGRIQMAIPQVRFL